MIAFRNGYGGQVWLEVMLLAGVTGMPTEVERLAEVAARIADRIQLNTAVRPPAESFVAPVTLDSLQELASLFTPHAEVIADTRPPTATEWSPARTSWHCSRAVPARWPISRPAWGSTTAKRSRRSQHSSPKAPWNCTRTTIDRSTWWRPLPRRIDERRDHEGSHQRTEQRYRFAGRPEVRPRSLVHHRRHGDRPVAGSRQHGQRQRQRRRRRAGRQHRGVAGRRGGHHRQCRAQRPQGPCCRETSRSTRRATGSA